MHAVLLIFLLGISASRIHGKAPNNGVQTKSERIDNSPNSETEKDDVGTGGNPAEVEGSFVFPSVNTSKEEGKRQSAIVKRTIFYPGSDLEYGSRNGPFCYDRYVTGNCRYRTDPEYCFQYEWTAYAIIENLGGIVRSDPAGLFVEPGNQDRVRVWVKTSCCTPYIRFLSTDPYNKEQNACVVDVRELQGLHPGEIAGIVFGVLFLLLVIIVAAVLLIRKRNTGVATVENDCPVKTYGFNTRPSAGTGVSPPLQHPPRANK